MGVLSKVVSLTASLSLLDQAGMSILGTLNAPSLPKFLTNNPLPDRYPWGKDTVSNTNPYHNSPNTGMTRKYDFTLKRATLAPDGFERELIVVNGQYPGPTIEANWGDMVELTVHNEIEDPAEGTSIHWHGFLQHKNAWMDGTPGFTQCPIAPGKSFTYSFKAELFGTSWYHAHYSAQYADGPFGPIVVYGPWDKEYDIDVGPVVLNDFYHVDWQTMVKNITAPQPNQPPPMPTSDSNLINGKMRFDCTSVPKDHKCSEAGLSQFRFKSGKSHRLRLMNTGADAAQQFSIDGHSMTVFANDFVAVKPYTTNVVTLGVGQRTDVIVEGIGNHKSSYWMRSNATCANSLQPNALAVIFYDDADTKQLPTTQPQNYAVGCANDPLSQTVPEYPMALPEPATTIVLDATVGQNASGVWLWYMNRSSFRSDFSNPVLQLAKAGNTSYPYSPQWNVYNTGKNSSYRFIFNNKTPLSHPMHLHGHNMYILDVGVGSWDGKAIARPNNPQRRDTQMVPANGYMVMQADADNPGAWDFHCHILWHSATGFGVDILEQPDQIKQLNIPDGNYQLCKDWNAFATSGRYVQIDAHKGARESSREVGRWWETMTRQPQDDIKLVCA